MGYNLYLDKTDLEDMKNTYDNGIEKLYQNYTKLEETIDKISQNNAWEGESYDSFIEKFDKWKLEYLKAINRMIALKNFLYDLTSTTDILINDRDKLL